jgi:hypothetical protein
MNETSKAIDRKRPHRICNKEIKGATHLTTGRRHTTPKLQTTASHAKLLHAVHLLAALEVVEHGGGVRHLEWVGARVLDHSSALT